MKWSIPLFMLAALASLFVLGCSDSSYYLGQEITDSAFLYDTETPMHLAFTTDNTKVISHVSGGNVYQWSLVVNEPETLAETFVDLEANFPPGGLFAFSPSANLMVIRKEHYEISLIELGSRDEVLLTRGSFEQAAFSENGEALMLIDGKKIEVWDVVRRELTQGLRAEYRVKHAAISHDGSFLIAFTQFHKGVGTHTETRIEKWDIRSGSRVPALIEEPETNTNLGAGSVILSYDSSMLAADILTELGSDDKGQPDAESGLRIWDTETGELLFSYVDFDRWAMRALAFSDDAAFVAAGDKFGNVVVWNTETGKELLRKKGSTSIRSMAFSHDNKYLAAGLEDSRIQVWEINS